jgi:hypothetical protein
MQIKTDNFTRIKAGMKTLSFFMPVDLFVLNILLLSLQELC